MHAKQLGRRRLVSSRCKKCSILLKVRNLGARGKWRKAGPHWQGCRALPGGIWAAEGGTHTHNAVCRGCGEGTAGCLGGQRVPLPASSTGRPRGRRQLGCRPRAAPVEPGQPRHSACGFPPLATAPGILRRDGGLGGTAGGEAPSISDCGRPYNNKPPGWCHRKALPGKEMLPKSHTHPPRWGLMLLGGTASPHQTPRDGKNPLPVPNHRHGPQVLVGGGCRRGAEWRGCPKSTLNAPKNGR